MTLLYNLDFYLRRQRALLAKPRDPFLHHVELQKPLARLFWCSDLKCHFGFFAGLEIFWDPIMAFRFGGHLLVLVEPLISGRDIEHVVGSIRGFAAALPPDHVAAVFHLDIYHRYLTGAQPFGGIDRADFCIET